MMGAHFEIWDPSGHRFAPIEEARTTIGRAPSNHICLPGDPTVSRMHAAVQRYQAGWSVSDLGSANGTLLNGQPVVGERGLRSGDELRVGGWRLVFRATEPPLAPTARSEPPPDLTGRERDVLVALCTPLVTGGPFPQPATVIEMAASLNVSEATVKFHLGNIYDKFGIEEEGGSPRRSRLANEALRRGAVSLADLKRVSG